MPVQPRDYTGAPAANVNATMVAPTPTVQTSTPGSRNPAGVALFINATAALTSPVIDRGSFRGNGALVISNTAGGSPTVNVDIQGSVDNINYYNIAYALVATPTTIAVAQIAITSTATTTYLLLPDHAWRYLRVVTSTVNNETYSVTYYQ